MPSNGRINHIKMENCLEKRLLSGGKYDSIERNVCYSVGDSNGEVDLLATRNGVTYFFEVKSYDGGRGFRRAGSQYRRFCDAHPHLKVRGVYVAPSSVRRLRHT